MVIKKSKRKFIILIIVIFLLLSSLLVIYSQNYEYSSSENKENIVNRTITVDDDGPADFSRIQDAIFESNDGDIITVQPGTYHENLMINKKISIHGSGPNNTNITSLGQTHIVLIKKSQVKFSGFTLKFIDPEIEELYSLNGIKLENVENVQFYNNNCPNSTIELFGSTYNSIYNNNCSTIELTNSNFNNIFNNTIIKTDEISGILSIWSESNTIKDNTLISCELKLVGTVLSHFNTHTIENNKIDSKPLIYLKNANEGEVIHQAGQIILVNCNNILVENQNPYPRIFNNNLTLVSPVLFLINSKFIKHLNLYMYINYR